MVLIVLIVLIV